MVSLTIAADQLHGDYQGLPTPDDLAIGAGQTDGQRDIQSVSQSGTVSPTRAADERHEDGEGVSGNAPIRARGHERCQRHGAPGLSEHGTAL